ncbi:MAG: hypothetical protein VST72_05670 [Nitrospirota bacterium]|nr:hypothetical protein [Nitrospirota bacterium]
MENSLKTKFRMFFTFAMTILATVLVLKLLNWIPLSFQKEDMRKYKTVEDVKTTLKIPKIYVPAYFPEHIKWPPAEIFAQKRPSVMIIMHFIHTDTKSFALSIYQADAKAHFEPPYRTDILYIRKESTVSVKGREGKLTLAVCRGNERCNRLSWDEGGYSLTLIADDSPENILKMAESML